MVNTPDPTARIKKVLHDNPKGIGITGIAQKAGMHRTAAAKYLELLRVSGHVEMRKTGMTKLYTLSERVPLSAMLNFKEDIIVILDDNGRIIQVNERYEAICRSPRDRIIGTRIGKSDLPILADPEILEKIGVLENPEILVRSYRFPGDDCARYYRIRLIPTVFEGGNAGVTIIGVDTTREQEISRQLSATETRYQTIIDKIPDLVCRFLPDFSITLTNRAFRDWFGDHQKKYTGEHFPDIVYRDDPGGITTLVEAIIRNALPVMHEQQIRLPQDGNVKGEQSRWVRWNYAPDYDPTGNLIKIQATGTEITREKELEEIVSRKNQDISFLSEKGFEFSILSPEADIYQFLCDGALALVPDAVISFSSFDPGTNSLTVEAIVGDRNKVFDKYFPSSIGLNMPVTDPESVLMLKSGNLVKVPGGLHVATFGQIPPMVSLRIEEEINWVSTYAIGLATREQILGSLVLLKCSEGGIERSDILTAFTRISTIALQKWLAEKQKRE